MNKKRTLVAIALSLVMLLSVALPVLAATTADVTVTATPEYIAISVAPGSNDFGNVAESSTPSTVTTYYTCTNTSSVIIDVEIYTLGDWTGGVGWTHSDTATPGVDTAGLKANKGGAWGAGDVIVKKTASYNLIADNQTATTNFDFGLKLWSPITFGDGVEKTNTVRLSAAAAS